MNDNLQKFMIEDAGVRGELVELSDTWQQVLTRHNYPPAVKVILGELYAASILLSANLKFDGTMIMQIYGDGPIKLMVVECNSELRMRATAKLADHAVIADDATLHDLIHAHGEGRFIITLDPNDKQPGQQAYQGIVPLEGDSISTVIENYMLRSEQLDTKIWLAADDKVARGMLLQKLPNIGGTAKKISNDVENWNRAVILGSTLKQEELLNTDIQTLMHRLFWEENVRVFDIEHPQFQCNCTREKVANMLRMLGEDEINTAIADLGKLNINCDFCGKHYGFDKIDCAQLFVTATLSEALVEPGELKH
jgi:molecular chaperone Hsp33